MTITQIISMKPIARAARIFNFLPCRNLPFAAWFILRQAWCANHPGRTHLGLTCDVDPARRGDSNEIEGVEHRKSNDRRGNAKHVAYVMSGHALPRLLGRHHGAR